MKKGILILVGLFFAFCLVGMTDAESNVSNETNETDFTVIEEIIESIIYENGTEVLSEEYTKVLDEEVLLSEKILIGEEIRDIEVIILENTTVTGNEEWDSEINSPVILMRATVVPSKIGYTTEVSRVVEIGSVGVKLVLDKAARIIIPGEADKKVGYSYDGNNFHEINDVCSGDNETWNTDALLDEGDCYLFYEDSLIIWTKHFTEYVTYTEVEDPVENNESLDEMENDNDGFDKETFEEKAPEEKIIDKGRSLMLGFTGMVAGLDTKMKSAFGVAVVMLGVLFLFLFSIFQGGMPGTTYFGRAAVFHRRAENAHLDGDYIKAKKLYEKSYSLREKGEDKVFGGSSDEAI